jgi:hypothetical protein
MWEGVGGGVLGGPLCTVACTLPPARCTPRDTQVSFQQLLYALHAVELTSPKGRHERSFTAAAASAAPPGAGVDRRVGAAAGAGRPVAASTVGVARSTETETDAREIDVWELAAFGRSGEHLVDQDTWVRIPPGSS